MGQLVPMIDQVNERYSKNPQQWLVDGGYPAHINWIKQKRRPAFTRPYQNRETMQ